MQVTYNANVCIHAGNCVKSLPAVFKAAIPHHSRVIE